MINIIKLDSAIQVYANKLYKRATGEPYILATWDVLHLNDVKLYYRCYQRACNKVLKGKLCQLK